MQIGIDHDLRQFLDGLLRRDAFANIAAQTHDRRGGAKGPDFLQLVADIQDRASFRCQSAERHKQCLHLVRCEDRGRLIHYQKPGILEKASHDLYSLALTHGKVMDDAVRVER